MRKALTRGTTLALAVAAAALAAAAADAAASPVQGSIAGPVTSVKGGSFVVKTSLSPTGSSKVTVTKKTTITREAVGKRADLKKGVCVTALGTKKGTLVTATRISLTPAVRGRCDAGRGPFGGRRPPANGQRPPANGQRPSGNGQRQPGNRQGFSRPANFGFAFGTVSAVKGSRLTVKGPQGSTRVAVNKKTQFTLTVRVAAKKVTTKECAFVYGTSTDKGVTVTATDVRLTRPRNGTCTFGRRRGA